LAVPTYVEQTDEWAREEAKAGIESLFNEYLPNPWEMLLPPGYMSLSSMKIRKSLGSRPRNQTIDELIESGTVMVGSAQTVPDKIGKMRDATGLGNMVSMLQFGVVPDDLTRQNMERFASEVMPHFRD
jgi:alkanesulfonate monooxygenase SsuD/methylene tetrahydromethanopterin reductase-like flavin-dependent oxidoreductase (luciferase family)